MRMFLVAIGLMLAMGAPLSAGDVDEHSVAADAKWLVEVNLDAARESTIGKAFRAAVLKNDKAKQRLEAAGKAMGLNLAKDIHGLLLYDRRFVHERGVAIIRADADIERLTAFVEKLPDYKKTDVNGRPFHTFTHKKHNRPGHPVTVCLHDKGIVMGRDASDVATAVKVLDGKSPSLMSVNSPLGRMNTSREASPPGTILHVRAVGLDEQTVPFKSPIVRQSKSFVMEAGESDGKAFARASLTADSSEVAQQIKAVVEGYIAVAKLQCGDNEEAKKMFRAAKVSVDDDVVTVHWKGPAERLLRIIEKQVKRHAGSEHGKKHGSRANSNERK